MRVAVGICVCGLVDAERVETVAWVAAVARKEVDEGSLLRQLLGATPFEDREPTSGRIWTSSEHLYQLVTQGSSTILQ